MKLIELTEEEKLEIAAHAKMVRTGAAMIQGVYLTKAEYDIIKRMAKPDTVSQLIKRCLYQNALERKDLTPLSLSTLRRMAYPENAETWV